MSGRLINVSPSAEEYLLTLYRLENMGQKVGSSYLARMFAVKVPSVTGMLRRLHTRGWVKYRRYNPPELTEQGLEVALHLIRRHRLLETFLVEKLGYTWDEVHDEVHVLEHSVTDRLLERIDDHLGRPSFDPHGEPIPDRSGRLPHVDLIPLTALDEGQGAVFQLVGTGSRKLLARLGGVGAFPGVFVSWAGCSKPGRVILEVGDRTMELSHEQADRLLVVPRPQ